ncbi:MAG: L,D-transpeptidase family protein [bacterium]|nr:L,D-transpeptidase family protein [bacterium]MDZ4284667.1 L,D-transpeptidase family protein [Patescibacteria group bacterium]
MTFSDETKKEFEESETRENDVVHVHFIHRHIPTIISYPLLAFLMFVVGVSIFLYANTDNGSTIMLQGSEGEKIDLVYGSWPALQNAHFFQKTKEEFISQGTSFIEADLSAMIIRLYRNGELLKEAPIQTKGRDGSWWQTPAGLYKISSKEKNHFSSFGRVFMPWSMQFQGNFFIHGPTHYPDGSPTPATYSGGCIRVSLTDAEELYRLADRDTPVLVFEESFNGDKKAPTYKNKNLLPGSVVYLAADLENNFVFTENKPREKRPIASITKLMSALVAVEYINVEREVTVDSSMLASTSIPRLKEDDRVSVLDLLSLLLVESSNEAAVAVTAPVGKDQFIKLMNTKSEALGMSDSNFVDTSGVLAANISTAEDLFHLAKYLYYNRSFILHMSMGNENRTVYGPSTYDTLQNLNQISGVEGMVGGKTGLSSSASHGMLAVFEIEIDNQKRPVAIIVLGSDDAKNDAKMLLRYVKDSFSLGD